MAWHHAECWDTHGACSSCGKEGETDTRALTLKASTCAWPGCRKPTSALTKRQQKFEGAPAQPELIAMGSRGETIVLNRLCSEHAAEGLRRRAGMYAVLFCVLGAMTLGGGYVALTRSHRLGVLVVLFALGWIATAIAGARTRRRSEAYIEFERQAQKQERRPRPEKPNPKDAP